MDPLIFWTQAEAFVGQDTAEWERKGKLYQSMGAWRGSQLINVAGFKPYRSPRQEMLEWVTSILYGVPPPEPNDFLSACFKAGHVNEARVFRWFQAHGCYIEKTGRWARRLPERYGTYDLSDVMTASPDALMVNEGKLVGVEIKTVISVEKDLSIQFGHILQCYAGMYCTRLDEWVMAYARMDGDPVLYKISWNQAVWEAILAMIKEYSKYQELGVTVPNKRRGSKCPNGYMSDEWWVDLVHLKTIQALDGHNEFVLLPFIAFIPDLI